MKIGKLIGYNLTTQRMDDNSLFIDDPIKIFDTAIDDVNYEDVSSIENWDIVNKLDWARRRDEISPLFYAVSGATMSNYGNLSSDQKLIGAKYFLVPYSLRVTNGIVTDEEDMNNWNLLLSRSKESRIKCVEAMRVHVGQYIRTGVLTLQQTQEFFRDVFQLINWFNEANLPDFKQWITNEVGSAYENAGFADATYYSVELRDELMEIYNGKY